MNVVSPSLSHCPPFPLPISLSGCLLPHGWSMAATLDSSWHPSTQSFFLICPLPQSSAHFHCLPCPFLPPKMYTPTTNKTKRAYLQRPSSGLHYSRYSRISSHMLSSCLGHHPLPSPWSLFSFVSHTQGQELVEVSKAHRVQNLRKHSLTFRVAHVQGRHWWSVVP